MFVMNKEELGIIVEEWVQENLDKASKNPTRFIDEEDDGCESVVKIINHFSCVIAPQTFYTLLEEYDKVLENKFAEIISSRDYKYFF